MAPAHLRRHAWWVLCGLSVAAGCNGDVDVASTAPAATDVAAVTDAPVVTVAAAPVAMTAPPPAAGAPAYCQSLASSESLAGIAGTFALLANPSTASAGAEQIRSAADDARAVAANAPELEASLTAAGAALDNLANSGLNDTAIAYVEATLGQLGAEVQQVCDFPLG